MTDRALFFYHDDSPQAIQRAILMALERIGGRHHISPEAILKATAEELPWLTLNRVHANLKALVEGKKIRRRKCPKGNRYILPSGCPVIDLRR